MNKNKIIKYTVISVAKEINLSYWKFVALARKGEFEFVKVEKVNGRWRYYFDPLKTAKYIDELKKIINK